MLLIVSVELPNRETASRAIGHRICTGSKLPSRRILDSLYVLPLRTLLGRAFTRLLSMHTRHNTGRGRLYRQQFFLIGAELIREIGELDRVMCEDKSNKVLRDSSSKERGLKHIHYGLSIEGISRI